MWGSLTPTAVATNRRSSNNLHFCRKKGVTGSTNIQWTKMMQPHTTSAHQVVTIILSLLLQVTSPHKLATSHHKFSDSSCAPGLHNNADEDSSAELPHVTARTQSRSPETPQPYQKNKNKKTDRLNKATASPQPHPVKTWQNVRIRKFYNPLSHEIMQPIRTRESYSAK